MRPLSCTPKVVMRAVRRVADSGRTVICTIHQPSAQLFLLFHRLLLLKKDVNLGGRIVFFGDVSGPDQKSAKAHAEPGLVAHLSQAPGAPPLQPRQNPADWMLEVIGAGVGRGDLQCDFFALYAGSPSHAATRELLSAYSVSHESKFQSKSFESNREIQSYPSLGRQVRLVLAKMARTYWRCPNYTLLRQIFVCAFATLFGVTYFNIDVGSSIAADSVIGAISFSTIYPGQVRHERMEQ
jgi:hypothetical protein